MRSKKKITPASSRLIKGRPRKEVPVMKRTHIKKRTAVGAMAFIMLVTYAVPGFGLCHTVSAEENNEPYNTSAGANASEKVGSLIADMIRTDDGLKKILKGAEAAMNTISIYSPAIKFVSAPALEMLKALYSSETPEITLDRISQQMDAISDEISRAKKDMIDAMSTANDMSDFVGAFNEFERSFREMNGQISQICGYDLSREEKDTELAEKIGFRNDWMKRDNVVSALTILGNYLSGDIKLSSGNRDIYSAMMNHYSKTVCFGKEAMDRTDRFVEDAAAIYLQGALQTFICVLAEKSHLIRIGTNVAMCDADYCLQKAVQILEQMIKVYEALKNYKETNSPYMFYDRSGGVQKNILLQAELTGVNFRELNDLRESLAGKALGKAQMEYIVNYAKQNYPGLNIQQFLERMGFAFADITRDQMISLLRVELRTFSAFPETFKKEIARLNRNIEQIMNTTPYEWAKMHPGYTKGAYIMTDTGYCDAVTMNTGCALKYYYRGVRLQDTACGITENRYLYKSEGFDTTIRNESIAPMYYLAPAIV